MSTSPQPAQDLVRAINVADRHRRGRPGRDRVARCLECREPWLPCATWRAAARTILDHVAAPLPADWFLSLEADGRNAES